MMRNDKRLTSRDDATRLLHHLIYVGVLRLIPQRMEKKKGQNFANTQWSIAVGRTGSDVIQGKMSIKFAVQVLI